MRSKKAFLNMVVALIELVITTITSFIVPHYIITSYGSGVNGLLSSITQFLSYISLIESGIGIVGRASLYKPLADRDMGAISENVKALENFYRRVSYIFIIYVVVISCLFPMLVNKEFEWGYTATLIIIMAFSTFIQYYFGITYQTVIQADQKKYIPSLLNAVTLLANMIFTVVLIKVGASIQVVKLGSAIVYAIRPLIMFFYVKKYYKINKKARPRSEILTQRWDGFAQHIAFFIHKNTDIAVLTILASIKEVSVYSVYMLAVSGCSKVVNIFSNSLEPAFGNMIANGEKKNLKNRVRLCSTVTIQISIILFSTVAIVITPFVEIYTKGIVDVNYIRPVFGIIMLMAEAFYCVRIPYQSAVYAAGHIRQTRNGAILEAMINIVLSIFFVFNFGLIGVAIGTMVSMLFRTSQYIWYYHVNLIQEKDGLRYEIRRGLISIFEVGLIFIINIILPSVPSSGYIEWIASSCLVFMICSLIIVVVSVVLYKEEVEEILVFIKRFLLRIKP